MTYDKFEKEALDYKLITPAVVSERLKIHGSLARTALQELPSEELTRLVSKHKGFRVMLLMCVHVNT